MSVLIKGMKMPISCLDCFACHVLSDEGLYCEPLDIAIEPGYFGRLANCPLVPVPPHGRLGDLDALYEKFSRLESEAMNALKTTTTGSVNWIKWSAILTERTGYKHDIADAPTIIAAEEGKV